MKKVVLALCLWCLAGPPAFSQFFPIEEICQNAEAGLSLTSQSLTTALEEQGELNELYTSPYNPTGIYWNNRCFPSRDELGNVVGLGSNYY